MGTGFLRAGRTGGGGGEYVPFSSIASSDHNMGCSRSFIVRATSDGGVDVIHRCDSTMWSNDVIHRWTDVDGWQVGLRWWSNVKEDGTTEWVFESLEDMSEISNADYKLFWIGLYGTPVLWLGLFITGMMLFKFQVGKEERKHDVTTCKHLFEAPHRRSQQIRMVSGLSG